MQGEVVPLQPHVAPLQPAKTLVPLGAAVSVAGVDPMAKLQVPEEHEPPPVPPTVTVPVPAPATVTFIAASYVKPPESDASPAGC